MPILTLGISYRRSPIELLERLSFGDDGLAKVYGHALDQDAIEEFVLLSTCNRVEVYAAVPSYHAGFLALKRVLAETSGVGSEELAEPLYAHWEQDAADHLFSVAAGLDSMVIGETQIHTQVREALRRADAEGAVGPTLKGVFHAAGRVGRRVRAETALAAAPDAYVALAADLAAEALGGLRDRAVVVVGAGQMAGLAAKHLRHRGARITSVLNRSFERARTLAERVGATPSELHALPDALRNADLVVTATGATGTVIDVDVVGAARDARPTHTLVLLDLAVPRDVDGAVRELAGVRAFDIEDLRDRLASHDGTTAEEIARARELVVAEVRRWTVRRRSDAMAPLIRAIRRRGDDVVRAELARYANRLTELTRDEREAVEAIARGVAAKLLHDPIVELKERSDPGPGGMHATVLAELLGVEPDPE